MNTTASGGYLPSRFIVAYQNAHWEKDGSSNKYFDRSQCRAGISFDHKTFQLTKYESPLTTEKYIKAAEANNGSGSIDPVNENWGCKLDICGSYTYQHFMSGEPFDAHPIWHSIVPGNSSSQALLTNTPMQS